MDLNKILRAVTRAAEGIPDVDASRVAVKTIGGMYDGASTQELDRLSIQTASGLIAEEPAYSKLAASLLAEYVRKEVVHQDIQSFSQSISMGVEQGLINDRLKAFVDANTRKLNNAITEENDGLFEFFGLRTVYDRYLLKHPTTRKVIETPQYFFMRVAAALSDTVAEALELYRLMSRLQYMPSTPTLFNAGTAHEQMSSCYLMAPPSDSIEGIYDLYAEIAFNSKFAGGIGSPWGTVRSEGSLIKGTNGESNGIIPWIATLNMSVAAVNQGGKRKGAAAIYLPTWHADILQFLELRDNTGDHQRRTHNLNLAHWIPDAFMRAVEAGGDWYLLDPKDCPELNELFGDAFTQAYYAAVDRGLAKKTIKAQDLYGRMMRTLSETGNGWMCFADACNVKCNQTSDSPDTPVVHSSNLCTEITEVSRRGPTPGTTETAVCNLGSVVLPAYVRTEGRRAVEGDEFLHKGMSFDFFTLRKNIKRIVRQLDRVIDHNFYPIESAALSNHRWRPIGLGMMGLQDVFFLMGMPFDSLEAQTLSTRIAEEMYFAALSASADLAEEHSKFHFFEKTRAAGGNLQFDLWAGEVPLHNARRWVELKERIKQVGLRNSLLLAIAPTATIGSITGVYECVEPQVANLVKRETLSGEFVQINRYLVRDLKKLGLWTEEVRNKIKVGNGSVQAIPEIPAELRHLYRTAWELSNKNLIDMAAARGPFIDQSQSLNLFMAQPNIGKMSSMYMHAWKSGLKTTYYMRSRPATEISKTTVAVKALAPQAAVACSLENPESCESCQ